MNKNGWQVKSLGEVAFVTSGQGAPQGSENFSDKGYPFIRAGSLEKLIDGRNYDQLEKIEDEKAKKHRLKLFSKGCILFAKSGMSSMKDRVIVLKSSAYVVSHLAVIQPNQNLNSKYLAHWLGCFKPSRLIKDESYPSISLDAISKTKIPLPPLPIQKQIAEILEKADQAKQKRKEANKLVDEFLQSLFIEMFGHQQNKTKGITIKKLKEITTQITDGVHAKPTYVEKGVPFISVKDITTGKLIFDKVKYIPEEEHRAFIKRCKPEFLDILYTKVGATYGRPALVDTDKEFSIYVSVALIKPNHSIIDPFYLRFALQSESVKLQADKRIRGIGVPDLHLIEIKNFDIIVPPLKLQQQFAEIVNKTEALKEKQKQSGQELENLFQSLMQKAFKGELVS